MADRTQRALGIARRTAHQHAFDRFADGGEVALPEITVRPDDPQPSPEPPPDDQGYWPEPYTMQPGDPYDPLAASAGVAPSGTPSLAQKAVDWWKAQPSWLEQAAAVHKQSDPTRLRPTEAEIDFASGMVGPAATEAVGAARSLPDVLYHGTRNAEKIRASGGIMPSIGGEFGPGVYMAPDSGTADFFATHVAQGEEGPSIIPVNHGIENPFYTTKQDWLEMLGGNKTPRQVQAELKKQGYDGIVAQGLGGGGTQVVAFNHAGVKPTLTSLKPTKPFYSAVEQAVGGAKMNAAPAQQWLGTLRNAPGVKPEELDWLGVPDFLQGKQGPVPKQDLLDHIANNKVDVQEVEKGVARKFGPEEARARLDRGQPVYAEGAETPMDRSGHLLEGAGYTTRPDPTKFGTYTLPGGENYRELLLTMPDRVEAQRQLLRDEANRRGYGDQISQWPDQEFAQRYRDQVTNAPSTGAFRGSHWEEPNVLAHVRFDDRVVNGDRTLHMAEIQSDWHQKGRREGYNAGEKERAYNAYVEDLRGRLHNKLYQGAIDQGWDAGRATDLADGFLKDKSPRTLADAMLERNKLEELNEARMTEKNAVPDAPFKTTWPELALKRMIRYAAENGYDRISWDSGATNAERYDLSKHVAEVAYNTEGRQKGTLQVFDHNRKLVANPTINSEKELADYIGKDAADKLLNEPTKKLNDQYGQWHVLSGLDLKVGGEGMKGFYDKMLPTVANKLGKKYGARVEDANLPGTRKQHWGEFLGEIGMTPQQWTDLGREGQEKILQKSVHTLKITPELRKAALQQGFPMFARGGKVTASQMARRHAHQDAFDRTFPC